MCGYTLTPTQAVTDALNKKVQVQGGGGGEGRIDGRYMKERLREELPTLRFPVKLHGVYGKNERYSCYLSPVVRINRRNSLCIHNNIDKLKRSLQ